MLNTNAFPSTLCAECMRILIAVEEDAGMLIIRKEQMALFPAEALNRHAALLSDRLTVAFPEHVRLIGGPSQLPAFAKRATEKAVGYGIDAPSGVEAFAGLLLQFGESFERSPLRNWVIAILANPSLAGALKIETILEKHHELTGGRVAVPYCGGP
jgi:hypothetical protein